MLWNEFVDTIYALWLVLCILQSQLGEPRKRGVTLPEGFAFGQPNAGRDGGANEGET